MEEKNVSELMEAAAKAGVELSDDMLDTIAGGAFTEEEWWAMTDEERKQHQLLSFINIQYNKDCDLL